MDREKNRVRFGGYRLWFWGGLGEDGYDCATHFWSKWLAPI